MSDYVVTTPESPEPKPHSHEAPEWHQAYTAAREQLEKAWAAPQGLWGWLSQVNHQSIGKRYIVTAFIFLLVGGVEALLMRSQLAGPEKRLLSAEAYNQVFTLHGSTMMFLFAVPVMEGMGIYLVPLLIGTRNVAFPRLNALGYFMYLAGGFFLYTGVLFNMAPDVGWFAYVPLSGPAYSAGKGSDFWAQMITFTEISALIVAVELIVTIAKMRAPGMSLNRMPLFVWAMFIQSFMVIFAMPAVMAGSTMLLFDRSIGTHFFNPPEGGDPLLYQHIFWFFGHPEVYIIFIPALGFVSHIVTTFTRRPVFGYTALVLSQVINAFVGFTLWVHHMFATGLPQLGESFFTAASLMIAIPSGIQIFCWLAMLWSGRPRLSTSLWFVIGFLLIFVLGGLSGVMIAAVPFNLQVTDTYFIVAHFHYVLIGGALFPLFGAFYYWFPKLAGRMLSERLGYWNFALMFIGFNMAFFPMHIVGLNGMTRRIYTYQPDTGWGDLNLLSTIGAFVLGVGILLFIVNVIQSVGAGEQAGENPWNANTLEWAADSPPRHYNFVFLPVVESRDPLWTQPPDSPVVTGLHNTRREVICTHFLDAEPYHRYVLPNPTIWPLVFACTATYALAGSVFNMWHFVFGSVLSFIPLLGWFWPRNHAGLLTGRKEDAAR